MIPCPAHERIRDYLGGRLDEPARQEIVAHAAACVLCRLALAEPTDMASRSTDTPSFPPLMADHARPVDPDAVRPVIPGYDLSGAVMFGGMGVVYFGTETVLRRPVAVKVLRRKLADEPALVDRFEAEARVCAQLQHPGIVPVYQVGRLADGRPFYAMKLVKGDTLGDLLKRRPAPPTDLIAFLAHFRRVCEAMAYAHAHKVLHRDLKPANVMVGAYGEVLLMDWGLAKVMDDHATPEAPPEPASRLIDTSAATGDRAQTSPGAILGTFAFMPPEQASGRVEELDARSDVFGLGAILFTILTGQPPYLGPNDMVVLHQAMRGDLADAEMRLKACGADVDLLALTWKCLAPQRAERPADAGAVAQAMTTYLENVEKRLRAAEVEHHAAEVRAVEERKRRRLLAALAAVGLAAVLCSGFFWRRSEQTHNAARLQIESQVNHELGRADSLREQARGTPLVDTERRRLSARLWDDALASARKAEASLATGPATPETSAAARARIADLRGEAADCGRDRALLEQLDAAREKRADVTDDDLERPNPKAVIVFGRAAAGTAYAQAFRVYGIDVLATPPEAVARLIRQHERARVEMAAALDDWLALEVDQPRARQLLAVACLADPHPFRNRLRAAVAAGDAAALRKLSREAQALSLPVTESRLLADGLHLAGELHEAVEVLRRAQRLHPSDFWINDMLGVFLASSDPSRADEASRYFAAAIALRPESYPVYVNLGMVLEYQCRWPEALAAHKQALRIKSDFFTAQLALTDVLIAEGDRDEALRLCQEVLARQPRSINAQLRLVGLQLLNGAKEEALLRAEKLTKQAPNYPFAYCLLGRALSANSRPKDALAAYNTALRLSPHLVVAHLDLASNFLETKEYDKALHSLQEARKLNPNSPYVYFGFTDLYSRESEWPKALASCRRAVALRPAYWRSHLILGNLCLQAQIPDAAIAAYEEASRLNPNSADVLAQLGKAYQETKQFDEAISVLKRACALQPQVSANHNNLGYDLLHGKGNLDGAIAAFQEAIALDRLNAVARANLGEARWLQGDRNGAVAAYQEAAELCPRDSSILSALGYVLLDAGRLEAARNSYQQVLELTPNSNPGRKGYETALKMAEELRELESQLPEIVKGETKPKGFYETLRFGRLCRVKKQYAAATRYYDAALALDSVAAAQLAPVNLLVFARTCLLAANKDNNAPTAAERARYRSKALKWLGAYLQAHRKNLEKDHDGYRYSFQANVRLLLQQNDLASVRTAELAKLPEEERLRWEKFWAAVNILLTEAETPRKK